MFVARRIDLKIDRFRFSRGLLRCDNVHKFLLLQLSLQSGFQSSETLVHRSLKTALQTQLKLWSTEEPEVSRTISAL